MFLAWIHGLNRILRKQRSSILIGGSILLLALGYSKYYNIRLDRLLNQNSLFTQVQIMDVKNQSSKIAFDFYYVTENDTIFDTEYISPGDINYPFFERRKAMQNIGKMKLLIQYSVEKPLAGRVRFDLVCDTNCYNWKGKVLWDSIPPNWRKIDLPRPYDRF